MILTPTTTVSNHIATVRQFNSASGVATVIIPGLYGDTPVEARPFLTSPAEVSNLSPLTPGDTVIAFYDGGNPMAILRWYRTGGGNGGGGGVPPTRTIATTAPLTGGGDLTADRTLAINTFTPTVKGVVPPPSTVTGKYLKDDGTWAVPLGGDEVWVGTSPPVDPAIELWYDPEAVSPQPGPGGSYVHVQAAAAAVWVIVHNLGYYPNVRCEDTAGDDIEGDVVYDNINQMTVTFSIPVAGKGFCS